MIYAMSDIHGCIKAFEEQLQQVDLTGGDRLILLGDYIDFGDASGQVLRRIYGLQKQYGKEKVIVLKGNHEELFLEWIDEFAKKRSKTEIMAYDTWLKVDSEQDFIVLRTLLSEESFAGFEDTARTASFTEINKEAVRLIMEENADLIRWMRGLLLYYETDTQIFVHAGVDEKAGEDWPWATAEEIFLFKFPADKGPFLKTLIAGHVGTYRLANDKRFHDIYFDGESHYYIDGSVYRQGKLLLLAYDEEKGVYYRAEDGKLIPVKAYDG